jgi:hypothetical protein
MHHLTHSVGLRSASSDVFNARPTDRSTVHDNVTMSSDVGTVSYVMDTTNTLTDIFVG